MLWIYLPSSTDLKLCSDVPIIHFVNTWTFLTVFTSRHLGPNIWERSTIDWFTFFGLLPGRAVSISWIWLVYFFFGLLLGRAVPIGCGLLWFTYRLLTDYWFLPFCWFTLVYLVYEFYFLDMSLKDNLPFHFFFGVYMFFLIICAVLIIIQAVF